MPLIPTILCGGAGPRLWPVSRELHPKLFLAIIEVQSGWYLGEDDIVRLDYEYGGWRRQPPDRAEANSVA